MKGVILRAACAVAVVSLGACDAEPERNNAVPSANEVDEPPVDLNEVDLPPPIVRSVAYRCQDGDALYVDVLAEKNAVLVRDSRADTPVRLEREGGEGSFTGDDRTLSGTGDQVIYASPDRLSQACRQAEGE